MYSNDNTFFFFFHILGINETHCIGKVSRILRIQKGNQFDRSDTNNLHTQTYQIWQVNRSWPGEVSRNRANIREHNLFELILWNCGSVVRWKIHKSQGRSLNFLNFIRRKKLEKKGRGRRKKETVFWSNLHRVGSIRESGCTTPGGNMEPGLVNHLKKQCLLCDYAKSNLSWELKKSREKNIVKDNNFYFSRTAGFILRFLIFTSEFESDPFCTKIIIIKVIDRARLFESNVLFLQFYSTHPRPSFFYNQRIVLWQKRFTRKHNFLVDSFDGIDSIPRAYLWK